MSGLLALAVVVAVVLVVAGARHAARPAGAGARPSSAAVRAIARTTGRWRAAGLLGGAAAAAVVVQTGALGRGWLLAAPMFGLVVLAGAVTGELRAGRPRGAARTAALRTRRIRDALPPALSRSVLSAAVALALLLVVTTATGSTDDLGRPGRELLLRCSAAVTEAHGPWPGSFYSLPVGGLVLCGLLVAGLALRRVVLRPWQPDDPDSDDLLRSRSAEAVTAAAGVLVAVPLAGAAAVAAAGLQGVGCGPVWFPVLAGVLAVVAIAALVVAAWCAVALVIPRGRRPAEHVRGPAGL